MISYEFAAQCRVLAYSLLIGVLIGIIYDLTRLTRLFLSLPASPVGAKYYRILSRIPMIKRAKGVAGSASDESDTITSKISDFTVSAAAFIADILFFAAAALIIAVFVFQTNTGRVRGFVLAGTLAGAAVYLATLGRLTLLVGELTVFTVRSLVRLALLHIVYPSARAAARFMSKLYSHTLGRLIVRIKNEKLRRERIRERRKLLRFCLSLGDMIKEGQHEFDPNVDSREAHNTSRLRFSDNHLREPRDPVQRARGRKGTANRRA